MEGFYNFQTLIKSGDERDKFIFNAALFLIVFLSMLEPKQVKTLLGLNIIWFYPQYIILAFLVFWRFRRNITNLFRRNIIFGNPNKDILSFCYLFSCIYILSALLNFSKSYDIFFSLRGLFKVLLQYIFFASLAVILVADYPQVIVKVLKYLFMLSAGVVVFILIGIFGYIIKFDVLPFQKIIDYQIISQSWVKILNFTIFFPKFGGVFPETQALGFFLLIAYISYTMLKKYGITFNKVLDFYGKLLSIFSILTFSKTVIPAVGIFLIWNNYENRKSIKNKVVASLLFFISFYFLLVNPYALSVKEYVVYGTRIDLAEKMDTIKEGLVDDGEIVYDEESEDTTESIRADSLGERAFHVVTFFNYAANNILSFLVGMGPYNYGNYIRSINPDLFNRYTNAVSIFTVFIESGLLGFSIYLLLWGYMIIKSKSFLTKCALFSLLIGNVGQPNWSMDILLICVIMVYSLDKYGRTLLNENSN
ncbi:hypothetical protein KVG29_10715 [Caldicoprobacter algeriensis]|uniref:hypothetical protein n=1 Tax=Caldicoprobacter algeriensis TaxID=699281 RepID=UPI002079766F|nr:hypothetical protein [Caldicoprobacter algeriensis]MCM8901691.1 hypothetical protein [Caldicoprobacter algeriensis]